MMERTHGSTDKLVNDPMMIEIQGEAFTFPAEITVDKDGEALRRAERVVRALSATQFEEIIGEVSDWPEPEPYINTDASTGSNS